jgi:hypothetical protein
MALPPDPRPSSRALRALAARTQLGVVRSIWALLAALAGVVFLLSIVGQKYPVRNWFALPMGEIVAWQILLNLGWVGTGLTVLRRFQPLSQPPLERLVVGVATGVVSFAFSLYLLGVLGLFRPAAAIGLVFGFVLAGLPELVRWVREYMATPPAPPAPTWLGRVLPSLALGLGVIGAAILYLGILPPDTINYDARWWHLSISEGYVREGRMIRFPGNWVNSYPHLASLLHTWDFLIMGSSAPALRLMMVLHTEFSLFVWTLVGVAATVRWLVEDEKIRGAWATYFLFPGIFIYDSNIGGAADHVMASFVLPIFLLTVRLPSTSSERGYLLWGAIAAGALLSKLHAMYVLVPLTLLLAWTTLRSRATLAAGARRLLRGGGFALLAFLIVTAPHFGTNLAYHSNPFYPLLQDWFTASHPTIPQAPMLVRELLMDWNWKPTGTLPRRIADSLALLFTFAFTPHYSFSQQVPVFGFAFTLALPLLFAVRGGRRLWIGAFASLGALFCWANTVRVDRNLQTFLPLLVATTAAILVRAWRVGTLARIGVGTLVLAQVVWAGDLWFQSSDRVAAAMTLIRSGFEGRAASRFAGVSSDYLALDRALPKDAVVLLHHSHPSLGINRPIFLDWVGFQGSIDYRQFANERSFYDRLRKLGITHVVYLPGEQAAPSRQEDVILHSLGLNYGGNKTRLGTFEFYKLPDVPPPERGSLQVLAIGLPGYADGLYDVTQLGVCQNLPPQYQNYPPPRLAALPSGFDALLETVDAVLIGDNRTLPGPAADKLARWFQSTAPYPGLSIFIRKLGPR